MSNDRQLPSKERVSDARLAELVSHYRNVDEQHNGWWVALYWCLRELQERRGSDETNEYPSVHVISVPWCQCCEAKVPADHICSCEQSTSVPSVAGPGDFGPSSEGARPAAVGAGPALKANAPLCSCGHDGRPGPGHQMNCPQYRSAQNGGAQA